MTQDALGGAFEVRDAATGRTVSEVIWVDDVTLEYATPSQPIRLDWHTLELAIDIHKVTRVLVDYANRVIHVNEPPLVHARAGIAVRELHACAECCQADTCRRIDYCAAFKCGFGEAKQP